MKTQLQIVGGLLTLCGLALVGLGLWWIYHPLCPSIIGIACLYFGRVAYGEAAR